MAFGRRFDSISKATSPVMLVWWQFLVCVDKAPSSSRWSGVTKDILSQGSVLTTVLGRSSICLKPTLPTGFTSSSIFLLTAIGMSPFYSGGLCGCPSQLSLDESTVMRCTFNRNLLSETASYPLIFAPTANSYADSSGTSLAATEGDITYPSAAAITYRGDSGEEEMHIFFTLAWFDLGSWAWGHYIFEWGTKGVFAVSFLENKCCRRDNRAVSLLFSVTQVGCERHNRV